MLGEKELSNLLETVRVVYGYDFTEYAEASVMRRVMHFMSVNRIRDKAELQSALLKDETFFARFVQELTVNVTEMFRDPAFYLSLREKIIPRLATYPVIKIWIAGCSTGEEVYSVAILLKEEGLLDRSVIYATDINPKVVQQAQQGVFALADMQRYTRNYQMAGGKKSFSDYYVARYELALFEKTLRKHLVFAVHNLTVDKSFNEFHLILCRNVLIYFNQMLQNKVINLFHESLCNFGYLGLGNKESLLFTDRKKDFKEIDRKERLFMRSS